MFPSTFWDASVKAVVPDLYEHAAYVSLDLYSSEIKFKYGGLQLKTDAAGIGKLISFAVPLIGDENLEALLSALGSIDFDAKPFSTASKQQPLTKTARRGVNFSLNLGGIVLNTRVSETESAYAPEKRGNKTERHGNKSSLRQTSPTFPNWSRRAFSPKSPPAGYVCGLQAGF